MWKLFWTHCLFAVCLAHSHTRRGTLQRPCLLPPPAVGGGWWWNEQIASTRNCTKAMMELPFDLSPCPCVLWSWTPYPPSHGFDQIECIRKQRSLWPSEAKFSERFTLFGGKCFSRKDIEHCWQVFWMEFGMSINLLILFSIIYLMVHLTECKSLGSELRFYKCGP